jgi:excisionase family DNA binding protein
MKHKKRRRTATVDETAEILGIGRNLAYEAVRCGQIPNVRIGGRYLVPLSALERFLGDAQRAGGDQSGYRRGTSLDDDPEDAA